jgi:hypothetical protein
MELPVPSQNAIAIAQTYGLWIQTGAICLSALAAVLLILWTQRVASRRATLDLMMLEQSDPAHIEGRREFIELRNKGNLIQWIVADKTASKEAAVIRAALNRYELVAIGIARKTVDAKLYHNWCRTTLVSDWMACKPFIMQLRQNSGRNTYFCEFEKLALKWSNRSEKPKC